MDKIMSQLANARKKAIHYYDMTIKMEKDVHKLINVVITRDKEIKQLQNTLCAGCREGINMGEEK